MAVATGRVSDVLDRRFAFLTVVVMPFNYSITDGISWGFVSYTLIKYATGRAREVH